MVIPAHVRVKERKKYPIIVGENYQTNNRIKLSPTETTLMILIYTILFIILGLTIFKSWY